MISIIFWSSLGGVENDNEHLSLAKDKDQGTRTRHTGSTTDPRLNSHLKQLNEILQVEWLVGTGPKNGHFPVLLCLKCSS